MFINAAWAALTTLLYGTHGFSIVTKDSDFQERTILVGSPPKVIWLRTNNCASEDVADLLRAAADDVRRFIDNDRETCLILS
jgi:predicted nuclease of predicted toxin-antitoxin system